MYLRTAPGSNPGSGCRSHRGRKGMQRMCVTFTRDTGNSGAINLGDDLNCWKQSKALGRWQGMSPTPRPSHTRIQSMFQENRSHSWEHMPFLCRHPDIPIFTNIRVFSRFCCIGCDFQLIAQAEPNKAASFLSGSYKTCVLFSISYFESKVNQLLLSLLSKEPKKWTLTLWRCPMALERVLAPSQAPMLCVWSQGQRSPLPRST